MRRFCSICIREVCGLIGQAPSGVTGLNLYSLAVAIVGAIVVLVVYHAIQRAA
jgi:uncharacterized membrane protein YeaQ/YmgE (transglycosylase-associated protein family)